MKKLRGNKGLTLIELVVVTALLAMLIGASVSLYHYGMSTYNQGEELARVQRSVRLAEYIITNELRTASGFTTTPPSGEYKGISVNPQGLVIFYASSPQAFLNTVELIQDVSITFRSISGSPVIEYRITGASKSKIYTLSGKLHLVNMEVKEGYIGKIPVDSQLLLDSIVLYYEIPA